MSPEDLAIKNAQDFLKDNIIIWEDVRDAVLAEREACAEICQSLAWSKPEEAGLFLAEAIRNRPQPERPSGAIRKD